MANTRARTPVSQRGNALMVSLVFLVILTTLGLSVAGTGRLELMMAANTQFDNQAYQAAESGIDSVLRIAPGTLRTSIGTGPLGGSYFFNPTTSAGGFPDPSTPGPTLFAERATTTTTDRGETITCKGDNSVGVDVGFAPRNVSIDSRSQSQRGGRAGHEQGFCLAAPNSEK